MEKEDLDLINKYNIKNICNGVFIIKNFLSKEECENISKPVLELNRSAFRGVDSSALYLNDIYIEQAQIDQHLNYIKDKVLSLFNNKYTFKGIPTVSKMIPGSTLDVHADNVENRSKWPYTFLMYLTDFEGGEIYYPEYNAEYKTEQGDLLIHDPKLKHGVKLVTGTDTRVIAACFIYED